LRFKENQKRRKLDASNRTQKPAFLPQSKSIIAPHAPNEAVQHFSGADVRQQLADQRRFGMETQEAQQTLNNLFADNASSRSSTSSASTRHQDPRRSAAQNDQTKNLLSEILKPVGAATGKKRSFADGDEDESKPKVS
jgi:hypothetical protein